MNLLVDQPIINSPFKEPERYWLNEKGQPVIMNFRRPAGYYFKARRREDEEQLTMLTDEQFVELELVNTIRKEVKSWRDGGYSGATQITRQLLQHWNPDASGQERERPLFFCQWEAAETII